jgi:flagellar biosynthesis anti-sigma factor FlgM
MSIPCYYNTRMSKVHLRPPPVAQRKTSASKPRHLKRDQVSLSLRAAEALKLSKLARTIPDIRQEKVEATRRQIESGTYTIYGRAVARSIVNIHLKYILTSDRLFRLWKSRWYRY